MRLSIRVDETLEQSANKHFEKAKKARKKLKGLEAALETLKKKEAQEQREEQREEEPAKKRKKLSWYEKFRWFISSDGLLCVAGRDATTNEIIIKKHVEPQDLILHTQMAGSPFLVIKSDGAQIKDETKKEAAQFVASTSRAWKSGLRSLEVFVATPDQVSKQAMSGEYMSKGSFMVRGKTTTYEPTIGLAACMITHDGEEKLMVGPLSACKTHAQDVIVELSQGAEKASDVAKQLQKKLGAQEELLDTIIRALPAGTLTCGSQHRVRARTN